MLSFTFILLCTLKHENVYALFYGMNNYLTFWTYTCKELLQIILRILLRSLVKMLWEVVILSSDSTKKPKIAKNLKLNANLGLLLKFEKS